MFWFLLVLFFFGIVFGAIARLLVPGRDPLGIMGTWALGVAGSFVGGFLGYALLGADIEDGAVQMGGIFGSIIGSVVLLLVVRALRGRGGRSRSRRGRRRLV
ncbi:MAG: GlsB/YeaQ/YmgE family stress response membrane protein [Acidimicrobiia bacterium]